MTYRCVVIDDEKPARDRLKRLLAEQPDFELVGEAADSTAAVALLEREKPELCFLDVQMPEGDGFKVLRDATHAPVVVFTTAYDEYAVRAFEVRSLDYLLKPFSKKRFEEALARARQSLEAPETPATDPLPAPEPGEPPTRISARRRSSIVLLDPADVMWFEAEDTLVFACTESGRFLVERTLAELADRLGSGFFRANRGCLVNLARIAEIQPVEAGTYRIVFGDETRSSVPLSRRQARKLRERIPW